MSDTTETVSTLFRSVTEELQEVHLNLLQIIKSDHPQIDHLTHAIIKNSGKQLRPALTLLSAGACGCRNTLRNKYAVVIELIHTASLLHDDVIDNAKLRRGIQSINHTMGNQLAILGGDYLYSKAISLTIEDTQSIQKAINETVIAMTKGEIIQSNYRFKGYENKEQYMWIIEQKSARLMELSCRLGAMISNNDKQVEIMAEYGKNLGLAYQIIDDLLDWIATEKILGKTIFQDVTEGRITLPAIILKEHLSEAENTEFSMLLKNPNTETSKEQLMKFRQRMIEFEIPDKIRSFAEQLSQKAVNQLTVLPSSKELDELKALPSLLLNRKK